MATHYLLPCQCGKKTEIDSSQAGLTVRCACGSELAVPAMRGLAGLERVERAPTPSQAQPASMWGPRQGMMFLGAAVVVAAALVALYFWLMLPEPVTLLPDYQALNRNNVKQLTLEQTIDRWHELRFGIESPMEESKLDNYDRYVEWVMQWITVCGGVAGIGCLLIVVGLFIPSKR
jgi:hypothetical protein